MDPAEAAQRDKRIGRAIFLTFFGLYLLFGSRSRPWADGTPIWQVAESIVKRGSIVIQTQWLAPLGADGKIYSRYPLAASVLHIPGAAARELVSRIVPGTADLVFPLASHVGPSFIAAWTCVLFFRLARRFAGTGAASLATLAVGLGTGVCYYARSPYSEAMQTFAFTGLMLAAYDGLEAPTPAAARRLGLWAGILMQAKLVLVIALPGLAVVLAWRLWREPGRLAVFAGWAALLFAPFVALLALYNWARWGSALDTGYDEALTGMPWRGFWGLLFSPGKSIFLYSPPLFLAVAVSAGLVRRHTLFAVALAAAFVPVLGFYSGFPMWDGDWAWGPRYLTFALPALCLPLALSIDSARAALPSAARRLHIALLGAVFAAGLAVQIIGCSLYWGHWFRVASAVSENWLRRPNCGTPVKPNVTCYPDDKPLWAVHWLPSLQPIAGHIWLLRHAPFGDSFAVAEADAPWQVDGKVHVAAAESWYKTTIIDWWPLGWQQHPAAAVAIAAVMAAMLGYGAVSWRRRVR